MICKCFVCSPKPEASKVRRLSEGELLVALGNQRPNPAKSSIMSNARFNRFMGRGRS